MGQAKNRGTFEERKAAAIAKKAEELSVRRQIAIRRPSPKRMKLALTAAMLLSAINVKG